MGWYFTHRATRQDVVDRLIKPWTSDDGKESSRTIKHASTNYGRTLWALKENTTPNGKLIYVGCYLLQDHGGWGYKPMDCCMGPYEGDCPIEYVNALPEEGHGAYCKGWRDKVRAQHAAKLEASARIRRLEVGQRVTLPEGYKPREFQIVSVRPLRGAAVDTNRIYRLPRKALASL